MLKITHYVIYYSHLHGQKVKDNWGSEIVGVYEKDTLVASSLVLIKPLPAGFTMLYTPRGPVMDYTNERLVSYFMAELKKFGKKNELYL